MAKHRKDIHPSVKLEIIQEAGNKCANPGCSNWRVHIHHIKPWAIYQSNEASILIAVCPTCHDAIHHGSIKITDEILFQWKGIKRELKSKVSHVYIEPSKEIKLLTGTIALSTANKSAIVFELSKNNKLGFRIHEEDIALLNLKISDLKGNEVLRVSENHIKVHDANVLNFKQVPGHVKVTTNDVNRFLSSEFIEKMRIQQPGYPVNGDLILIEIEVIKPGIARVKGCWADSERAVIITDQALSFLTKSLMQPLSMVGEGENSVIVYTGAVNCALFGFKDNNNLSALKI